MAISHVEPAASREARAFHESGHAAVALDLGVPVVEMTLSPGRVRFDGVTEDPLVDLRVRLAGHVAEQIACADDPDLAPDWSDDIYRDDRARADAAAWLATGDLDAMAALIDDVRLVATATLLEHWPIVERFTLALLQSPGGRLVGADLLDASLLCA